MASAELLAFPHSGSRWQHVKSRILSLIAKGIRSGLASLPHPTFFALSFFPSPVSCSTHRQNDSTNSYQSRTTFTLFGHLATHYNSLSSTSSTTSGGFGNFPSSQPKNCSQADHKRLYQDTKVSSTFLHGFRYFLTSEVLYYQSNNLVSSNSQNLNNHVRSCR